MLVIAYILFWAGLIASAIGSLRFLVVVFRYSTVGFFACGWIPFASWIYFYLYMKQTWKPMLIGAVGFAVMLIGGWLIALLAG